MAVGGEWQGVSAVPTADIEHTEGFALKVTGKVRLGDTVAELHQVSRIVVACPDPHGGATRLDRMHLGGAYTQRWPQIELGPFRRESCELIIQFLRTDRFLSAAVMLEDFLTLQQEEL